MPYTPNTWVDGSGGGTPITAARLNNMEAGIEDADTRLTALATWAAYTPALTADTTDPTLGAGSTIAGRWTQIGKHVTGFGRIVWKTGLTVGVGQYRISLPVTGVAMGNAPAGSGFIYDDSAGLTYVFGMNMESSTYCKLFVHGVDRAGPTVPIAWANNDQINFAFNYEAA